MRIDGVGVPYPGSVTESSFANPESVHAVSMARQMIINGNMNIAQRGTSFVNPATGSYTLDRYQIYNGSGTPVPTTLTHSQFTLTPGELPGSMFAYRIESTGNATNPAGAQVYFVAQAIENGTRYFCKAGQQITVSFYARSSIPGKRIGFDLAQFYGTGGSGATTDYPGHHFELTTEWQQFSYTFTTVSIDGKTLGPDDFLQLRMALVWGPSWNVNFAVSPEPWGGAGTIDFTQLQMSEGPVPLPFAQEFYHDELEKCRRYFQHFYTDATNDFFIATANAAGNAVTCPIRTSPKLRVNPTAFSVNPTGWSVVDPVLGVVTPNSIDFIPRSNESFILVFHATFTAGASVFISTPTGVYLQLNAEW